LFLSYSQKTVIVWVCPQKSVSLKKYPQKSGKGLGLPTCDKKPILNFSTRSRRKSKIWTHGVLYFIFFLLCHHTASSPITSGMPTGGVQ